MSKVRTVMMIVSLASLAACGGSKEPAAEPDGAQSGASTAAEAASETAAPPPEYMQCVSCHSVKPGVNGVGPSLHGVVGRKAASVPGYAYSDALKNAGLTWDAAALDKWLTAPMQDVPGTKMVFPGMPDPAKRKAVIDYLATVK